MVLCAALAAPALRRSGKEGKWVDMPKAKPLPDDPVAREKVLRRRRQVVKWVKAWCDRNPGKVRVLKRYWKAAERLKKRGRALAALGDPV